MTDDHLDDLASAHLDGETSPEEAAQVAADARVQATVRRLRAVQAAVRAVAPADPDRRELAVAAALAEFDEAGTVTRGATPLAGVAARRRPSARSLGLLGAAAAVALLIALVPVLGRLGGSDDASTAARSADSATTLGAGDSSYSESQAGAAADGDASSTTAASGGGSDLGRFDSVEALVAAVEQADPPDAQLDGTLPAIDPGGVAACPAQRAAAQEQAAGQQLASATAVVVDEPVTVLFVTTDTGSRVVTAVFAADCRPLVLAP